MKIKVKASTMVKPMIATPSTTLSSSNLDLVYPEHCHARTVYFYPATGAPDFFNPTVLKTALSRVLVQFYPLAGRLQKAANDRIQIDCKGEGVLFVEAEADGEMNDLGDFGPRPELGFIPAVDFSGGLSTYPIVLLQVTRFECGGVCLGIAYEHHISDGISALHFINTWSDVARGADITDPPSWDRSVLSANRQPQPRFSHVEYQPAPTLKNPKDNADVSETIFSILKLTRDQLDALKASGGREDDRDGTAYSTFEVLAGHAWRCVCKARGLPEDQETKLHIPVDGRFRLRPPPPQGYFGNVMFIASSTVLCGELESNSLSFAVRKIHEAIVRMDDEYLRSAVDYLELHHDLDLYGRSPSPFDCPNFIIVSWARLPFYDADFGWGRPVYVGLGIALSGGESVVLPSPTNDGSLLYAISLPKEQMQVFEKLFYGI